jgi:tRNA(Ile)-lysidine synthase
MLDLHPFQNRVIHFIQEHGLIHSGDRVLVAVSGGPDSVALLHVLLALRPVLGAAKLITVHLDHQLRGEESREDARFVQDLSREWGLDCICESAAVDDYRRLHRVSLEMAARRCRHDFFARLMRERQAYSTALAHHADDQAEEVLLRLLRGTGPGGLAGMAAKAPQGLIRPLLFATREDILAYVSDVHLSYRTDSTNLSPLCQRNVLRLEVLPLLRTHFHPRVVRTFSRCAALMRDEEDAWDHILEEYRLRVGLEVEEQGVSLLADRAYSLPVALQRRLLRSALQVVQGNLQRIEAVHVEALRHLLGPDSVGKQVHLPGDLRGRRGPDRLTIHPGELNTLESFPATILTEPGCYEFAASVLELRYEAFADGESHPVTALPSTADCVWIDADQLRWPLLLRFWQPGDRFRPLGLGGTMKLQDFFTNAKVSRELRHRIPLLCDQEKICWVVGLRLAEQVKVTAATRRVLAAQWSHRSVPD